MSESVADEEEDDIYKNLPDFKYDDTLKKLEIANKELEQRVRHLEKKLHETVEENLKLKEENHNLHENISSLLKTANNELKRKDRVIEDLRKENHELIFRRKKTSHKTESHKHTDDNSVQQEEELAHNHSSVQRHGGGLRLMGSTSNVVMEVKDVDSVIKADNILPVTQTFTTKSHAQYGNEVSDVSKLGSNPSASVKFFPVDSIPDNYSTSKFQKNMVETVFSARMRKRLNASIEKNKDDFFVSTNAKQLCHDEKLNSDKGKNHPDGETAGHNSQELEALETVKEAAQNKEKSVNSDNTLIELDSDSSECVELDSLDENQDHHCTTKVQSNMVETVFSRRIRNRLNTSTKIDSKEILVCTDAKQSSGSKFDDGKINVSKEKTENEAARLNNQKLKATENVKEAIWNEDKSVNAGNSLGEIESDYSKSAELYSKDENQDHHCTTTVQDNMVETTFNERTRNQMNSSTEKDGKVLVCMDTKQKQAGDSRIDEAKVNSSKQEIDTNDKTARHKNQELNPTEIVKEAVQNEEKSVTAGKTFDELHTVVVKLNCHSTTDIQKKLVENDFREQMRNQLNASSEGNDKGMIVYTGTKYSCDSKLDEVKISNSTEEREKNNETARHNIEELKAIEILKEATQNDEKSVKAGNKIGELKSNHSESVEFHAVDANQDCHSAKDVQKNMVETVFSEQMIKQLNSCSEKYEEEIPACTATKQSFNSRINVNKINSSKEETYTNETARHNNLIEFKAKEIETEATQKERKLVKTGNIINELESNTSGSIKISSVDVKRDSRGTIKCQKNVAETVFGTEMRKQLNASIEIVDSGSCNAKMISSKEVRGKNNVIPERNSHKIPEDIEVPLNERTFVNVCEELKSNPWQSVEFYSVGAKQDYNCTTKGHNNVVKRKKLSDFKDTDDSETVACTYTKQPDGSRNHNENINEGDRDINGATVEHKTDQKFESTINVKENETKCADTDNIIVEGPFTNLDNDDCSKNSTPEHVNKITSLNEQFSYDVHSKNHHSSVLDTRRHSPFFQKRHRSSSQSSSGKSSSIESCVIQSEERQNVQKLSQRENTEHAKPYVKRKYHLDKQTELIRSVKASASVRVANSVKSKYSRSRSKTPFDASRFKIPKLSSKNRVKIERSSVLEQSDSEADSARTRYSRQSSLHNSCRANTSYRNHSHVRKSFREGQHYTEHRKYKHRDSSPVRECSSSRYKHERRHSSAKFHDKDKRHVETRHSNVSKRPDSSRMETNSLLKKNIYCTDAENVTHSQKIPQNVNVGKSALSCFLGDEKHSIPSQEISQHQNVTAENYNERKTKRTKSFSLNEITEKENLNICKGYEYKLKKITFENKELRKPVSDSYHRLVSNSSSNLGKVQDTPEQLKKVTKEPDPICSLGSAVLATEEQRKENIMPSSDSQNAIGQATNDTESNEKKFCNSAVFKTDGVSVSIFRETCDFSTSRKRKSVVIRSQRTSGSHGVDSPEEKRQRLSNDDKIIVETTNASVTTVHDDKGGQSVAEKTASVESGITIPASSPTGRSRTDPALSLNVDNYIAYKGDCIPQEFPCSKLSADDKGLQCSTKDCSDHQELKFKNVKDEQSENREVTSNRKINRDTRIGGVSEELEEGEILDDSPVKTSTAVAVFSESDCSVTVEQSCNRNVSKKVSRRINPTLCSKRLLQFPDTSGQNKSSQSNRHSTSSPTLRHNKEQHQDTYKKQKMNFKTNNKYKILDKFQNTGSKDSDVTRKPSSQHKKASELKNIVTVTETTQDVKSVIMSTKFEKESCDNNDKDSIENGKFVSCQMNDTMTSSVVSEGTCLFNNDSQYTKSDIHWNKQSTGNEMKCEGEVQTFSDPKSLEHDFSFHGKDANDIKSDKLKKIVKTKLAESCILVLASGDTVDKNMDVNTSQKQEPENSPISDIGVHKETQPKSCQKSSSEHDKRTSKQYIAQGNKDNSVKSDVTPLSSKLVSSSRRKKNARMTISTSQSSLESEILMANLLQTHSSYKVGIHDESLSAGSKHTEEIANSDSCNDSESVICNASKESINTQSHDKHDSYSQRLTSSETTTLSSLVCQTDERTCNSEKSFTSPKEIMQKSTNFENEQIHFQEKSLKITPECCQTEVQDTDSVSSNIDAQIHDLNVNKPLEYETTCLHSCRELQSGSHQLLTDDRKDEVELQEISEATINECKDTLGKDTMKNTADGCAEIRGGKEPLSGEELLKILEGSFENESGGSENLAKESCSLQSENAVMPSQPQSEISSTPDFPSATNKKNIIIRRRSRKCVLEESPMEFITIKPLDDTNPDDLIDTPIAVSTDEPSTSNNSPVCVTPSIPLSLQHDDSSCSSSSSSASSRSSSSSDSDSSSSCSNSSSSMSVRSSVSGSSKSSTSGKEEESDNSNNTSTLRKSLRSTPARRLYQKKSQMAVHQPQEFQDSQELDGSLNSSSSGNTSDDTINPKKGIAKQLNGTWVKRKRPRNKR